MNVTNLLITLVAAIIAGVFASLIKPFVDWGIEKKRTRLESRKALITNARNLISCDSFDILIFKESIIYSLLCEHFSDKLNSIINMDESDYIYISENVDIDIDSTHKSMILKEINILAKKWNLE